MTRRIIVAITGASGIAYGVRAVEALASLKDIETHLIVSPSARRTWKEEEDGSDFEAIQSLADVVHPYADVGASVASGSFKADGLLVAPCSVKTLSGIVNCYADNLIVRAADVCLKERRRVVLLLRETPLHLGHIDLMKRATEAGAIIMPPVPAFYTKPQSLDDIVNQTVGRALDLFGIESGLAKRWKSTPESAPMADPVPLTAGRQRHRSV